jgi:DNA-binding GntR family transcriptional regulator
MTGTQIGYPEQSSRREIGKPGAPQATQPEGVTDLRLLVELSALRKLAERGFSRRQLSAVRALAESAMRSARSDDVLGYLQADLAFHQYLVDLAGDAELSAVARLVLAASPVHAQRAHESGQVMAASAREHRDLVNKLADEMVGAAEDLLRHHISPRSAAQSTSCRSSAVRDALATEVT